MGLATTLKQFTCGHDDGSGGEDGAGKCGGIIITMLLLIMMLMQMIVMIIIIAAIKLKLMQHVSAQGDVCYADERGKNHEHVRMMLGSGM